MKIHERGLLLLILTMTIFSSDCHRTESRWKGRIETVDKVTIVRNPISPLYTEDVLIVREERSIGEAAGRDEYAFSSVSMIAVDDEENIYVADTKQAHIRVFDKNGNYLRTIGRRGQGPGEFNNINALEVTSQNELMVCDNYGSKLAFFSLIGNHLRTDILKGIQAIRIHRTAKGSFLMTAPDFRPNENGTLRVATAVNEHAADLRFVRTVVKDKFWNAMIALQPSMLIRYSSVDQIICGYREDYEIHVFNPDGEIVRKIFKEYEPYELSEEEKKERRLTRTENLPKYFPPYEDISIDDKGRLFVQLYEKPKDRRGYLFDIFDADGIYIAKVALKTVPQYWKKGKLYTIEEDENGYQYVKRYKVTWKF